MFLCASSAAEVKLVETTAALTLPPTAPWQQPTALTLALRLLLQAVWLYVLPADALEMLRTSAVKVAKAAQAVAKFALQASAQPPGASCLLVPASAHLQ